MGARKRAPAETGAGPDGGLLLFGRSLAATRLSPQEEGHQRRGGHIRVLQADSMSAPW